MTNPIAACGSLVRAGFIQPGLSLLDAATEFDFIRRRMLKNWPSASVEDERAFNILLAEAGVETHTIEILKRISSEIADLEKELLREARLDDDAPLLLLLVKLPFSVQERVIRSLAASRSWYRPIPWRHPPTPKHLPQIEGVALPSVAS